MLIYLKIQYIPVMANLNLQQSLLQSHMILQKSF